MAKYRGAVIGLGWMGMLYDLGKRTGVWHVDDVDRPTPELDVHRKFYHYDHPGNEGLPTSYAEAIADRPEIDLIAAADRDKKRLKVFTERYGVNAVYEDAEEMLRKEKPDIVAVATNTKHRANLTCLAVECGAKGIFTEKPMAHSLEEADRMVKTCADAGVPLSCGAITTTHPSFARAKELVKSGEIGELRSIECGGPGAAPGLAGLLSDHDLRWIAVQHILTLEKLDGLRRVLGALPAVDDGYEDGELYDEVHFFCTRNLPTFKFGAAALQATLLGALDPERPIAALTAAHCLRDLGGPETVAPLQALAGEQAAVAGWKTEEATLGSIATAAVETIEERLSGQKKDE